MTGMPFMANHEFDKLLFINQLFNKLSTCHRLKFATAAGCLEQKEKTRHKGRV